MKQKVIHVVVYCLYTFFASVCLAAPSCLDRDGKNVDRWFLLNTPRLDTILGTDTSVTLKFLDTDIKLDKFGFVFATATAGQKFGDPKAVLFNTRSVARKEINQHFRRHYVDDNSNTDNIIQMWFNDQPVRGAMVQGTKVEWDNKETQYSFERAHSKWSFTVDANLDGYVIMHSWPKTPALDPDFINKESFLNSQHAMCFNLGKTDMLTFLNQAATTLPNLLRRTSAKIPPEIREFFDKVNAPAFSDALDNAETCLQKYHHGIFDESKKKMLHSAYDMRSCSLSTPLTLGYTLITHTPLPAIISDSGNNQNEYQASRLAPIPWLAVKEHLKKQSGDDTERTFYLWQRGIAEFGRDFKILPHDPKYALLLPFYWKVENLPSSNGQTNTLYFSDTFSHQKMAVFINYERLNNDNNAVFCIGDANHTPRQITRAGMAMCFNEPKLASLFANSVLQVVGSKSAGQIGHDYIPEQYKIMEHTGSSAFIEPWRWRPLVRGMFSQPNDFWTGPVKRTETLAVSLPSMKMDTTESLTVEIEDKKGVMIDYAGRKYSSYDLAFPSYREISSESEDSSEDRT